MAIFDPPPPFVMDLVKILIDLSTYVDSGYVSEKRIDNAWADPPHPSWCYVIIYVYGPWHALFMS